MAKAKTEKPKTMTVRLPLTVSAEIRGGVLTDTGVHDASGKEVPYELDLDDGDAESNDQRDQYRCSGCEYVDDEEEFMPSDGNAAPHVCPKCGSTYCFFLRPDEIKKGGN